MPRTKANKSTRKKSAKKKVTKKKATRKKTAKKNTNKKKVSKKRVSTTKKASAKKKSSKKKVTSKKVTRKKSATKKKTTKKQSSRKSKSKKRASTNKSDFGLEAALDLAGTTLERRALRVEQNEENQLFLFTLTATEILAISEISRLSRDSAGKLLGYQRPEVKQHIKGIVQYLDGDDILFPNAIILALSSDVRFRKSRGPNVSDGLATGGTLFIEVPSNSERKPGWIVDGQQRTMALSKSRRRDFPVAVAAFIADDVNLQRDQFLRINNTKPLPRGLVNELLPEVSTPLPPKLAIRRIPSALCDFLNRNESSPFHMLIKRASSSSEERKQACVTDTSVIKMLQDSLNTASGCLFPYRNIATGETDFDGIWLVLNTFWDAVKNAFPEAWGLPSTRSRLMHGTGIRAMGKLMDRMMSSLDPQQEGVAGQIQREIEQLAPYCRWTGGVWEDIGVPWNEIQNTPRHIRMLSNYLIRTYIQTKMSYS